MLCCTYSHSLHLLLHINSSFSVTYAPLSPSDKSNTNYCDSMNSILVSIMYVAEIRVDLQIRLGWSGKANVLVQCYNVSLTFRNKKKASSDRDRIFLRAHVNYSPANILVRREMKNECWRSYHPMISWKKGKLHNTSKLGPTKGSAVRCRQTFWREYLTSTFSPTPAPIPTLRCPNPSP